MVNVTYKVHQNHKVWLPYRITNYIVHNCKLSWYSPILKNIGNAWMYNNRQWNNYILKIEHIHPLNKW